MALKAKRVLSCLVTALMLLTLLPVSAFAADNDLKTELGITNNDITVTEITEDNREELSAAALDRRWGLYAEGMNFSFGYIHSACHIASSEDTAPEYVTITMNVPTQTEVEGPQLTTGWAVLALVDGELVTYPTENVNNGKLKFTVRLGEDGTDLALSHLSDTSRTQLRHAVGDWGTLTLTPGEVSYNDSLGYVRSYKLTLNISDNIVQSLKNEDFRYNFSLAFYLNSIGLKIDADSISFEKNDLFELDPEQTEKVDDGCYMFTADVDINAWKNDQIENVVGISYAAPNTEPLLFEGEMQASLPSTNSWAGMIGCVPLPLTVVEPPNDETTYHKITVTQTDGGKIEPRGVEGEVWVKEGKNQTFTITPDQGYHIEDVTVDNKSVGPVETYTFNSVTDDSHSITATFAKNPAVTITPADLTIYEGGDAGYKGVVGGDGQEITNTSSFPEPLFKITMPEGSEAAPTDLIFTNRTTNNSWKVQVAGTDSEGTTYYRLDNTVEAGKPIRVQFIDDDDNVIESDTVTTTDEVFDNHTIAIFSNKNDVVTAAADGTDYNVTAKTGTLTVRAVQDTDPTSDIAAAAPAEAPSSGKATAVAPAGTTYTIGETGVSVSGGAPSLLFDSIIEDADSTARTKALTDRIQTVFGEDTTVYEIKYLDLVDANNGNAWIKASEPVDIYWGYPDGTTQDTKFTVVHFNDLHRDGDQSGYDTADIANCKVETISAESTEQGIKFSVQPGQFSPFALVAAQDYTITATAGANGTISPNGSVTVTEGDSQTFAITPNNGYHIEDVLVDGVSVGAVSTYTFSNVTANHTITATFERNSLPIHYYTITATAGEGGAIAPDGTVRVARGADRTFTISAAEGYVIADVLVDGESIGAVDRYTFENVRQNHTIEARFQPVSDVADPDDTGVSDWLNTDDHLAYLDGYPDNTFQPEEDMTRAEAAQMFYNLLRDQDVDTTVSFTDVAADAWYAEAVNTLATLEIVDGVGDNRFAPERTITRAEFTTMAMRFCQEIPTGENIFSDVDQDDWFYDYVVGSIQYGWINGYPDGTFRPNDTITRAEVTTIANRMLGRAADEAYVDGHQDQLRAFPDVTKGYWAYYDITEATNAHTYTQDSQGEDWTGLA